MLMENWCQKIILIGVLVIIIFDAGARKKIRILDNRKEKTTSTIVDAQSVKNTDTTKNKGYDAGKKVSGFKRHITVDSNGLPHAVYVTTADVTDRNGAIDIQNTMIIYLKFKIFLQTLGTQEKNLLIRYLKF